MATETEDKPDEIKRFEKDLGQCIKCGFCTFFCPVYQEERVESSVARGKNMMVRGLMAGSSIAGLYPTAPFSATW
jgi:Fe-S oxidoreductase